MRQFIRPFSTAFLVRPLAALSLLGVALLSPPSAFAHESAPRPTTAAQRGVGDAPSTLEGTLEILHEHRLDGGNEYHHALQLPDGTTVALDGVPHGRDLLSGDRVRARGLKGHTGLQLQASTTGSLEVMQYAPLATTFGVQTVAVLLVTFANDPRQPYTQAQARTQFNITDAFFQENSYGQTSLAVDLFGWYTLPISNTTCDRTQIATYARQAAQAHGVDLSRYNRHVFAFPQNSRCTFGGIATVGGTPSSVWINANTLSSFTIAHELGHSLGLYHSNALLCHPRVLDGTCTVQTYGDVLDMMGGSGHFNAFQKQRLGWLGFSDSPPLTTVDTTGTYTIDAYEFPGSGPKALRIPRGTSGQSFFVELRRNQGFDANIYRSGIFVHLGTDSDPNSSLLLDMVPETLTIGGDALLDVGKSFTDPLTGITITTVSVSATTATIRVTTSSACTRAAPALSATPAQSPAVAAGTAVTYAISVTNTDSAACPAASFTLRATPPTSLWQTGFDLTSVTLSPGTTAPVALTVTSPDVPPASYTIGVTATTVVAPLLSGSTAVGYTVATSDPEPPQPTTPFFDNFDRPDAPGLGNGWLVQGTLMIQGGNASNAASQLLNLAVQPTRTSTTQTVAASFASTNNNATPRFAVVVRYQDPQNYYLCSRQLGGSSFARIAKVRNGVETVLKSFNMSNTAVGAFSTLSCRASGPALTLHINGVLKVSVTDPTFTSGAAGFALSAPKPGAHRVDNFSLLFQ